MRTGVAVQWQGGVLPVIRGRGAIRAARAGAKTGQTYVDDERPAIPLYVEQLRLFLREESGVLQRVSPISSRSVSSAFQPRRAEFSKPLPCGAMTVMTRLRFGCWVRELKSRNR